MKAKDFLDKASSTMSERGKEYDKVEERSMGKAVSAFNIITGKSITEPEGWLLLQLLKDVRQWSSLQNLVYHPDSAIDNIAYAALKAESLEAFYGTRTFPTD